MRSMAFSLRQPLLRSESGANNLENIMMTLTNNKLVTTVFGLLLTISIFLMYMNGITKTVIVIDYDYVEELTVVESKVPTEAKIFADIAHDLPSSPIEFWQRTRNKKLQKNETCAHYPDVLELKYHNVYWQSYLIGNLTYYIYAAYYDRREAVVKPTPLVRVLAMVNQIQYEFPRQFCQMWFNESSKPIIVPVKEHRDIWLYAWGHTLGNFFYPILITCEMPEDFSDLIPQTVSLVARECDKATNNVRVTYEHPRANVPQAGFAVCVKALWFSYTDMSARLVEWLEMMRILGAAKVFIYDLQVHPNMTRVMEYYKRKGFIDFPQMTLARGEPNFPHFTQMAIKHDEHNHRLNQVLQLNDCLYRNMYNYEYLALIDTDEVIMPLGNLTSWHDIIEAIELTHQRGDCLACHCFQNVYYPRYPEYVRYTKAIPKYMYMLQHVRRVREHLKVGWATKCFHNTQKVITVHNHYPRSIVDGCLWNNVNVSLGQMQHYREPDIKTDLENPVIDDNMWRFKDKLVQRSAQVYREMGFLRKIKSIKTNIS